MPDQSCVIWEGAVGSHGYGCFRRGGTTYLVHRIVYERDHGPLPEGVDVHHVCEIKLCIEATHLVAREHGEHTSHHHLGTQRKERCARGHLISEVGRNASSQCRACHRENQRAYYRRMTHAR